jgi:hypothetical protein
VIPSTEKIKKPPSPVKMVLDDADNFLKLAASLKIILGHVINAADIPRARTLLKEYLQGYVRVREEDNAQ